MYFHRRKSTTTLLLVLMILIQFVLVIFLTVKVANLSSDFEEYQDVSMKRLNHNYSQLYTLNNRVSQCAQK